MSGSIPAEVVERIRQRVAHGDFPTVLVLPSAVRRGEAFYTELDIEAVKNAREVGVDAAFLDAAEDRRYLSEYGAGVVLAFAVSVMQDLTVDGLKAVGSYFLAQIRRAIGAGLVREDAAPTLRIDAEAVRVRPGDVEVRGLHVEAEGEQAITALLSLLGKSSDVANVVNELGLPPGPLELPPTDTHVQE
jgi:hypothetical protein